MLREELKTILEVQEFDIQMIRLIRLKREREQELARVYALRDDLKTQVTLKENEIIALKTQIRIAEGEVAELAEKVKKLESQQNAVKKVEEFNALTHEISTAQRAKAAQEQKLSDLYDRQAAEDDFLKNLRSTYVSTRENGEQLAKEIRSGVIAINQEGLALQKQRTTVAQKADTELLAIYEKLLSNKKNRVLVPIEERCCSGCHIVVTAQHENIVRKGEKLVFCEHCSRMHYWPEHLAAEGDAAGTTRRRRRTPVAV